MLSELGAELVPRCSAIGANCIYAEHWDHLHSHLHLHIQKKVTAQIQVQLGSIASIYNTVYHYVIAIQLLVTCLVDYIPMYLLKEGFGLSSSPVLHG